MHALQASCYQKLMAAHVHLPKYAKPAPGKIEEVCEIRSLYFDFGFTVYRRTLAARRHLERNVIGQSGGTNCWAAADPKKYGQPLVSCRYNFEILSFDMRRIVCCLIVLHPQPL